LLINFAVSLSSFEFSRVYANFCFKLRGKLKIPEYLILLFRDEIYLIPSRCALFDIDILEINVIRLCFLALVRSNRIDFRIFVKLIQISMRRVRVRG